MRRHLSTDIQLFIKFFVIKWLIVFEFFRIELMKDFMDALFWLSLKVG
jgi:hypothetical protein